MKLAPVLLLIPANASWRPQVLAEMLEFLPLPQYGTAGWSLRLLVSGFSLNEGRRLRSKPAHGIALPVSLSLYLANKMKINRKFQILLKN